MAYAPARLPVCSRKPFFQYPSPRSFFYKYADTILKKYSSTIATILTGLASAALFGHAITLNFLIGVSVVFISM